MSVEMSNPVIQSAAYLKAGVSSMQNSYSVMEKTLEATGQETPEEENTYHIDTTNVADKQSAGAVIDMYA